MYRTYKITNSLDDKIYVGCTLKTLKQRFTKHKVASRKFDYYLYKHMNNIGHDNFSISLLEERECLENIDKKKFEQEWIDNLKPSLNQLAAFVSYEDRLQQCRDYWFKDHDKSLARKKKYREENREKLREAGRRYYREKVKPNIKIEKCKCGGKISTGHETRHNKTRRHLKYMAALINQSDTHFEK